MRFDLSGYGSGRFRVGPEYDAAFFDIRAGNIDFQAGYAIDIEGFRQLAVFFSRTGRNIDNKGSSHLFCPRQDVPFERIETGIFQTDAIEHARRRFRHPYTGITRPRQGRNPLGNDSADFTEVEEITIFHAKSECTRSSHDGSLHRNTGECNV